MGALLTKWPKKAGGIEHSWGNFALKKSACHWVPVFNLKPLWFFLNRAGSQEAYLNNVKCAVPRLRELYEQRGLSPINTDAIYMHFRCSDVPFNFHKMFPMPRAEFLEYAMQVARERAPNTRNVLIESCTRHTGARTGPDTVAPQLNQIVCGKFAGDLVSYMRLTWPDYTFDLVCYPEAESIRRMLGSRLLVMTVPSSFAFVTGVQKGADFVTPKTLGVEPSWDTDDLHKHVPWSMYDGTIGTDSLTPVDSVNNYHQFDFERFLSSRGAIATRDGQPWIDSRSQTDRGYLMGIPLVFIIVLLGLLLSLVITNAKRAP